jgi:hypothetical protein
MAGIVPIDSAAAQVQRIISNAWFAVMSLAQRYPLRR